MTKLTAEQQAQREKDIELYNRMKKDPFLFIHVMRGLTPQLQKKDPFVKWKNITWQQARIVQAVKNAVNWGKNKITIRSWHGVGKSTILSMIIIWFLFCFKDCKIPCTAPTQSQMYDVLWWELHTWIKKLPEWVQSHFIRQSDYIRISENPTMWFARAATGKKENTEALAWLHADDMLLVVDEASWVPDEVFNSSKWALTSPNTIFIMISNPTRLSWYFYRSHNELKDSFACLHFNSEESPIVDQAFVDEIIQENGIESDQYNIRVKGEFPNDVLDSDWYSKLFDINSIEFVPIAPFRPNIMWVDPAGQGKDQTIVVARDTFYAKILAKQQTSTDLSVAELVVANAYSYGIPIENVVYDNFGVWANLWMEMSNLGRPVWVNVGHKAHNEKIFENLRAELYRRVAERLKKWGKLIWSKESRKDLNMIEYKRGLNGKIKIMSKDEMRKKFWKSPDVADALMMSFFRTVFAVDNAVKKPKPQRSNPITRTMPKQEDIVFKDPNPFK